MLLWGCIMAHFILLWGALKMQDVKMTDQVAVHENARHEIAGQEFVTYFSSIVM